MIYMKSALILKKLHIDKKEFVTSDILKEYAKFLKQDYSNMIKNLERRKYLTRIFRGIFYVKSIDEIYGNSNKYNRLELVAKGMELKNVSNWYFGLYTALKLNNMTHEYFVIDDVISDTIFRAKPTMVANRKFIFTKISNSLFDFGIKKNKTIKYSDPEKTILDFAYLWKFNGKTDARIVMDVSEWTRKISRNKIKKYSKHYPKSIQKIAGEIISQEWD